jgi:hypothetical protein
MNSLLGRYVLAIIGATVTISGFVALITASAAREFVKAHPYPIYIAFIATLVMLLAVLNYVSVLRSKYADLASMVDQSIRSRVTAHDVRYFSEVLRDIPANGPVITWLKEAEMAELDVVDVPADVLTALERTADLPRLRPIGFDDPEVAAAFHALTEDIIAFRGLVEQWTLAASRSRISAALEGCHQRLLHAYDEFIVTAHEHGLDSGSDAIAVKE